MNKITRDDTEMKHMITIDIKMAADDRMMIDSATNEIQELYNRRTSVKKATYIAP